MDTCVCVYIYSFFYYKSDDIPFLKISPIKEHSRFCRACDPKPLESSNIMNLQGLCCLNKLPAWPDKKYSLPPSLITKTLLKTFTISEKHL